MRSGRAAIVRERRRGLAFLCSVGLFLLSSSVCLGAEDQDVYLIFRLRTIEASSNRTRVDTFKSRLYFGRDSVDVRSWDGVTKFRWKWDELTPVTRFGQNFTTIYRRVGNDVTMVDDYKSYTETEVVHFNDDGTCSVSLREELKPGYTLFERSNIKTNEPILLTHFDVLQGTCTHPRSVSFLGLRLHSFN